MKFPGKMTQFEKCHPSAWLGSANQKDSSLHASVDVVTFATGLCVSWCDCITLCSQTFDSVAWWAIFAGRVPAVAVCALTCRCESDITQKVNSPNAIRRVSYERYCALSECLLHSSSHGRRREPIGEMRSQIQLRHMTRFLQRASHSWRGV